MSLCCRQQQLTAFRRVWPLADWREISKISIHKNSEECAHSHVLGMSTRMSLCRLPLPLPLSLCLSTCRVCAGVHVLPSGPNRLPSARQLFVTTSHSKGPYSTALHSTPLHFTLPNAALTLTFPLYPTNLHPLPDPSNCLYFWLHQFDLPNSFSVHLITASTVCKCFAKLVQLVKPPEGNWKTIIRFLT